MSTIGERIADLIEQTEGLNRARFAEKLEVSQAFVSQMCSGARMPSDRTIADICRVFHVNEQWLREGTGSMLIQRTASDELAEFTAELQREDSFRRRFISVLATLDPEDWAVLKKMADELAKRNEHE